MSLWFILLLVPAINGQHCQTETKAVVFNQGEKTSEGVPRLNFNIVNTKVEKWETYVINKYLPSSIICVKIDDEIWDCQTKNRFYEAIIWKGHHFNCPSSYIESNYNNCTLTVDVTVSRKLLKEASRVTYQAPIILAIPFGFAFVILLCICMTLMCSLCSLTTRRVY